ncbi:MAG: SAM-dependent methyltransferase [Candidatus Levybacteria bacterium]|nr:SAM-dependent methyltransferase [Candidatus Levybacteria bacterium]
MIINLIFLVLIILSLILLSWIWPPDSPWAPNWRTKKRTARAAFKLAKVSKKDIVYELGSGEATALMVAAKDFGAKGVGIEIEPFRFLLSKFTILRLRLSKRIKLIRGNFYEENLSDATVLYVYLVPKTLNRLIPKFKKELKKGTRIVSYKYEMNLPLKKIDKENELRLYVI